MPRHPIALSLPAPYPPLPTAPPPANSPLGELITQTLGNTDYDQVCLPLTNAKWQERWERLCLRPMDEDEANGQPDERLAKEREALDREADTWRREGGLKREEVVISRLEETQHVIALASDWLELDSMDEGIRFDSELALRAEFSYALYLAVPTLIIPAPSLANRSQLPAYARAIAGLLQMGGSSAFTQISIRIPISDPAELINHGPIPTPTPSTSSPSSVMFASQSQSSQSGMENDKRHKRLSSLSTRPSSIIGHGSLGITSIGAGPAGAGPGARIPSASSAMSGVSSVLSTRSTATTIAPSATGDPSSTWEMWECIRRMCGYHPRLTVTLDLTNPLPPSVGALARWISEPVKQVWLPAQSFIPNAKGYPVLSKACQAFLRGVSKLGPSYILAHTQPSKHQSGGPNAYLQYVRHITSTAGPPPSNSTTAAANIPESGPSEFASGYGDYLQAPLQPLKDDLGSATYEIFERDPVKYRQYEEAVFLALSDLPQSSTHVVTVVGAGRGPLVTCVLTALKRSDRKARVYAVEKNLSALVTLEERKALEWHDAVQVISGDMRSVAVPEPADIIVSELLGSFGDNELSPECLDGAMRFLKPQGISIPISYTAHLAPISSSKLHAEVTANARTAGAAETPYVVMMQAVNVFSGDGGGASGRCGERVQQCWLFEHPRRDLVLNAQGTPLTNSHNTRSASLLFHIPFAGNLHGLAGYFEAHLYSNIGLSIHPENAHRVSPDMFSWFPLFFPFKEPLYLPSGSELEVGIWRLWDGLRDKVWYEWSAEAYLPLIGGGGPSGLGLASGPAGASGSNGGSGGFGAGGVERMINGPTSRTASASGVPGTPNLGSGLASPMMDAPFSPGLGSRETGAGGLGMMRVKIGQTSLHNAGGVHSWVGL